MDSNESQGAAGASTGAPTVEERISALEGELRAAQQAARDARVRAHVHRALAGAAPVDLDAVALVVEAAVGHAGEEPDGVRVSAVVEELRRMRPALFRQATAPGRAASMSTRVERPATSPLADAAARAARSGDRASLLEYLRLRRTR